MERVILEIGAVRTKAVENMRDSRDTTGFAVVRLARAKRFHGLLEKSKGTTSTKSTKADDCEVLRRKPQTARIDLLRDATPNSFKTHELHDDVRGFV